ncbi:protein DOG1-like 4 [Salvia hispanica]|uniref:protein DOG1-like 4 n=1 Tax=Salvia hispanica TaxID=49212 RepID=UPI002008FE36|nr:protein DOG1-like 4 [Salvia hispanica]
MSFHLFYETWSDELRQLVHQLRQAPIPPATEDDRRQLQELVQKVISHYDEYHRFKTSAAKRDALAFFTAAPGTTSLERSLHWIAGWRPTTAFHLIYTESSITLEIHVANLLRGLYNGDLRDLSMEQFHRVSQLKAETVQRENELTDQLCDWQDETTAMVGNIKMEKLAVIVEKAEDLRLKTIKSIMKVLTPRQAAEFLVAAADLHFGIRAWGVQHDSRRGMV